MFDSFLYRRFFIVALAIAAMGAVTANLIQETRSTDRSAVRLLQPGFAAPHATQCTDGRVCLQIRRARLAA